MDLSTRSPSATTPPLHRWRSPGSFVTRPRCCPSQAPRQSRTLRRTWRQPHWSSWTRKWRCWRESDRRRTMDAGIVDPGNIGARAVPCLESCASLSRLWRADERTRTTHLLQLRVISQALQGFARTCKSRISKPLSFPWFAAYCTVLRSRWCQSGVRNP